jgi:hypothetical protein
VKSPQVPGEVAGEGQKMIFPTFPALSHREPTVQATGVGAGVQQPLLKGAVLGQPPAGGTELGGTQVIVGGVQQPVFTFKGALGVQPRLAEKLGGTQVVVGGVQQPVFEFKGAVVGQPLAGGTELGATQTGGVFTLQ